CRLHDRPVSQRRGKDRRDDPVGDEHPGGVRESAARRRGEAGGRAGRGRRARRASHPGRGIRDRRPAVARTLAGRPWARGRPRGGVQGRWIRGAAGGGARRLDGRERLRDDVSQRSAFVLRVRPDKIDEYVAAHREVWPEMLRALKDSGIRNYSIFRDGNRVFGYFEGDDLAAAAEYLGRQEVCTRWQDAMADLLQERGPDAGPPPPP